MRSMSQNIVNSIQQQSQPFRIESHFIQDCGRRSSDYSNDSFPVSTNQHIIVSPSLSQNDHGNHLNNIAVSMGSASSFSDCDSTTISHESHEENHEPIITLGHHSPNCRYMEAGPPRNKSERTLIIGRSISHSLSAYSEEETGVEDTLHDQDNIISSNTMTNQTPLSMKRVRSVSDFDHPEYSSPATIIARPRAFMLQHLENGQSSSIKRRFIECDESDGWQNACRKASHGYDSALPTLEEATLLFGFSNKN